MSEKVQSGGGSGSGGFDLKKFLAEIMGTACLTYMACGAAVLNQDTTVTSLTFGLTIMGMVYLIGGVSGCHINPAVSLNMLLRKKMSPLEFGIYCGAQILGGLLGSFLLGLCMRGEWHSLGSNSMNGTWRKNSGLDARNDKWQTKDYIYTDPKSNEYGLHKKDGWYYVDGILVELILTFIFVMVVNAATDEKKTDPKIAGLVVGGALAAVHLIGFRITGTSVNPARSLGPALLEWWDKHDAIVGKKRNFAIKQIWIFIVGPMAGGALAGLAYDPLCG